ncbi:phospholipase C [Raineyella antarctica]|uniref:Phospholipase C n=1 Tax=Raineyella antarctica TaxID=1577474 RepID=A0A1G6H3J8_9ACTN|nr:alkaline phosphatase family protein [Raineyella antarctica]SDB88822.1 phospholipase C [Raineyella antarctica]
MATHRTANIYVRNETDGTARIRLIHQYGSSDPRSGSWVVGPGQTAGPLAVEFETGFGSWGTPDRWSVTMSVPDGTAPGIYQNTGASSHPHWTECRLRRSDADEDIVFTASTTALGTELASGGCVDEMERLADYSPITNVFVLMLENRSFDHIFGHSGIPGLTVAPAGTCNTYEGIDYPVASPAPTRLTTDPGHEFPDVVEQLAGAGATYPPGGPYPPISMSGFAANYATSTDEGTAAPTAAHIGDVMRGFDTPDQLPTSYALATEFAICDHWFSSLPGPTWPNRMFVHAATSAGLDHSPTGEEMVAWETLRGFSFPHGTIFDSLSAAGLAWRLYHDNTNAYSDDPGEGSVLGAIAQVSALKGINTWDVHSLTEFARDLDGPYPYQYTFIEPHYGDVTAGNYAGGSSQHPMDDVFGGEALVKGVYEAIRNSPLWDSSLLVVTYDEHGGLYDSVPPVAATPPGDGSGPSYNRSGFAFDRLGVRVPALVISPLIPKGRVDHTVYDHSSVPKTVQSLFGLPPLTERDKAANDLLHLLTLDTPRTDCPSTLPPPVPAAPRPDRKAEADDAPDDDHPIARGNLPGFLGAAYKAATETYATTDADLAKLDEDFRAIRTKGQARSFLGRITSKVEETKVSKR